MVRVTARCVATDDCFVRFSQSLQKELYRNSPVLNHNNPYQLRLGSSKPVPIWAVDDHFSLFNDDQNVVTMDADFARLNNIHNNQEIDISCLCAKECDKIFRLIVEPLTYADQVLAVKHAELLAKGSILAQIRILTLDQKFCIKLTGGEQIGFRVMKIKARNSEFGILDNGSELEIYQPYENGIKVGDQVSSVSASAKPKEDAAWLILVSDPALDPGKAVISLQDLLLYRWTPKGNYVYLTITANEDFKVTGGESHVQRIGLLTTLITKKPVKPGHLVVHPNVLNHLGVPNGGYVQVASEPSNRAPAVKNTEFTSSRDFTKAEAKMYIESLVGNFDLKECRIVPSQMLGDETVIKFNNAETSFVDIAADGCFDTIQFTQTDTMSRRCSAAIEKLALPAELREFVSKKPSKMFILHVDSESDRSIIERNFAISQEILLVQLDTILKKKSLKDQCKVLKDLNKEVALISKEITIALSGCDFMLESAPQVLVEEDQWAHESRKDFLVELICRLDRPLILVSSISDLPSKITNNAIARSTYKAPKNLEKSFLSRLSLADGTSTSNFMKWESVRGLEYAKQALLETIIWPIKYHELYSVNQFERPGGVLLHGPSGCGKTMLMTALSTVGGFKTIIVRGPELIGKYIGTSEAAIRDIFKEARKHKPAVICFDELDALAPRRGNDKTGVTDRVVNQLLTEIDGTNDRSGVYVVATSSRPEAIDPALLRSGRIERRVEIRPPEFAERIEIIQSLMAELAVTDVEGIAKATSNFTAAQIKGLFYDAHLEALSNGTADVTAADGIVDLALGRTIPEPEPKAPLVGQKATFA